MSDSVGYAWYFLPVEPDDEPDAGARMVDTLDHSGLRHWVYRSPRSGEPPERGAEPGGLTCDVAVLDQPPFRVPRLGYSMNRFHGLANLEAETVSHDPATSVAEAFRDACDALCPAGAYLLAKPSIIVHAPLSSLTKAFAEVDGGLLGRELGLLYLPERHSAEPDEALEVDERDESPANGGRVVYAGLGKDRWWG